MFDSRLFSFQSDALDAAADWISTLLFMVLLRVSVLRVDHVTSQFCLLQLTSIWLPTENMRFIKKNYLCDLKCF